MFIFDYINKHIFGYDPVIKTKPCEKKDKKFDYVDLSSKTKSTLFLKLIDDCFTCTPIKRIDFDNIAGYENNSEDDLWNEDYLKPKFLSLYFYNTTYTRMIDSLKYKGYLSLIVAKDSVIDDIIIKNQKSDTLSFIRTDYFKRISVNNNIDKITIGIELNHVSRFNSDSIYSETSVPLTQPIASFINLNKNDEIIIKFTISFTKSILNNIESKAIEKISERTDRIALKHTYIEWDYNHYIKFLKS